MTRRRDKGNPTINDPDPRYFQREKLSGQGQAWGNAINKQLLRDLALSEKKIQRYINGNLSRKEIPEEFRRIFKTKDQVKDFVYKVRNSKEFLDLKAEIKEKRRREAEKQQQQKQGKETIRQIFLEECDEGGTEGILSDNVPSWLKKEIQSSGGIEKWIKMRKKIKD